MQKLLTLILLVAMVWLGYWLVVGDGASDVVNYPPSGKTIVAYGDSLVQGVGATEGHDWPTILSRKLGVPVVNMGRTGETTADALSRVHAVVSMDPDVVIILLGGNDALRSISVEETEENLRKIVASFQEAGAVTLIAGVRGGLASDPYGTMYWRIAKDTGSLLVTDVLRGLFGDRKYMSDAIHPNDAGYEVIASRIAHPLKKLLADVE